MKPTLYACAIAALTGLCAGVVPCAAQDGSSVFDPEGWTWQFDLRLPESPDGFAALPAPPELFDVAQARLTDVRIVDNESRLTPFVVDWGHAAQRDRVWQPVDIMNRVYEPNRYAQVTLDFGEPVRKNEVRLALSDANYRRQVRIEGSPDNVNWAVVKEDGWLVDIRVVGETFESKILQFPENDFRFLRITVFHEPDDPRTFEITQAQAARYSQRKPRALIDVPVRLTGKETVAETRATHFYFDVDYRNLPVSEVVFDIEDAYFHRGVELFGRNEETVQVRRRTENGMTEVETEAPWQHVHRGVLYRIRRSGGGEEAAPDGTAESLAFEHITAPYRYLQLRVHDGDDAPLVITGARARRHDVRIVFEARSGQSYSLYAGNPDSPPPSYDLARAVEDVAQRATVQAELADAVRLTPAVRERPLSERYAAVIWAALILAVATLGLLIVHNLKRLPSE